LNPVDYSRWEILQEKVYKTRITYMDELIKATENRVGQAGSRHYCGSHSSVAYSIGPVQWWVFSTHSQTTVYQIPSKSPEFCRKYCETNLVFFPDTV